MIDDLRMETLGNSSLLSLHKIGFLASSRVASLSVLPTLDWASETARRGDVTVMSGFRSRLEKQVLDFLLRGRCGIIYVMPRGIYKSIPEKFRKACEEGRVLFLSQEKENVTRMSHRTCHQANEYIAQAADELVFAALHPDSSLYTLSLTTKPKIFF